MCKGILGCRGGGGGAGGAGGGGGAPVEQGCGDGGATLVLAAGLSRAAKAANVPSWNAVR